MARNILYGLYVLVFTLFFSLRASAQTSEQKALEEKRTRLQQEIKQINRLLLTGGEQRSSVLQQVEILDQKIKVRQQLIRVTNQQANLLSRQITTNLRHLGQLREDLNILKDDYAELIQKSYQHQSQSNRLMFLLSAENFFQAFKRFQYMQQYAKHRKKQGQTISRKTDELVRLNQQLTQQRKAKERLVAQNTRAKNQLAEEIAAQQNVLQRIRQNETQYRAAIAQKEKETRKLDQQIERLIKEAIAAANRKADATKFILTPETQLIADNFSANKGRLIWPVQKGVKSQGYGLYRDKIYPGIQHRNHGVTIASEKGSQARAIFEGEVIAVLSVPGGSNGVQIKHGNYISTYYNLSKLYVKKGDKVAVKAILGDVYTNRFDGTTQLKFYLYQNSTRLNPEEWIYRL